MRKLLITLIVLVLLVVGADFAGRAIAESKAGEAIANEAGITPAPDVDVHGLSFLWQAVGGRYGHITLTSHNLTAGRLTGVDATADLYDVGLPLSDAIGGNIDNMTVEHADIAASLSAASLSSALQQQNLTVSAGDGGAIRLSTTVAAAGQTFSLEVDVTASVSDSTLHLRGASVVDAPAAAPKAVTNALVKNLSVDVPLTGLPFPLESATVHVDGGNLVLNGTVRNVKVAELVKSAG